MPKGDPKRAAFAPSGKEIEREQQLLNDPAWQGERGRLRGLIGMLRAADSDGALYQFQRHLIALMKSRQEWIVEQREHVAVLKAELAGAIGSQPKPLPKIRRLQTEIADQQWREHVQSANNKLLRIVADGLVWRRLRTNRAAITILGQGRPVEWLSSGRGWDAELRAIEEVWEQEAAFAIVHDATTCLRLGDLTCCFPDRFDVREVKAGAPADPGSLQMRRLGEATELINAGRAHLEGRASAVLRAPIEYATHLHALPQLLSRARSDGRAIERLSHAQVIVAQDLSVPAAVEREPFAEADAVAAGNWRRGDVVISFGTSMRRMRDRHHNFSYLAPLSLLPIDLDDVVDLLLGQLDYTTWVNVSAIGRYLAGRGFAATAHPMPAGANAFLTVERRRRRSLDSVQVAPHLREQMSIELTDTPTLAALVEFMLGELHRDPELLRYRPIVVAQSEERAWNLPRVAK